MLFIFFLVLQAHAQPATKLPDSPKLQPSGTPPRVQSLLKPTIFDKIKKQREVVAYAELEQPKYTFYTSMLVKASPERTRSIVTDYRLYEKMIPFVTKADYNSKTQTLEVSGGIWKFVLHSWIKFQERGMNWTRFEFVGGHLTGLLGDIYFEPAEEGTLVYFAGSGEGAKWPPEFVMERGAEVVFSFTANKMRTLVESGKNGDEILGVENGKKESKETGKEENNKKTIEEKNYKKQESFPEPQKKLKNR